MDKERISFGYYGMDDNRMFKEIRSVGHFGMKWIIRSFRDYRIVEKESRSGYDGTDNRMYKETISFGISYLGYDLASSVCALIFITLVLLDVWKAFRRKASWIPGKALALSALTIQLLLFSDHLDVSINSSNQHLQDMQLTLLVEEQLLIDSRRVMICVFIAYLLPGIVSEGLKSVWGNVGALALIVIAHMSYEAYFLLKCPGWEGSQGYYDYFYDYSPTGQPGMQLPYQGSIPIPSYIALSVAIILLVVLLSCAVIAGKSIRNIMSQKVPLALSSCCSSAEDRLCENIEDHVLKAWIVVRASQPDYIIARSVFTAFAGVVVTVCFVLLVVKWIYVPLPPLPVTPVYAFQFSFVVVGSIVVVFRWLTAVFYFQKKKDVRCFLYFEDFWTRRLVQKKEGLRGYRLFLSLLLTMLIWVQKFMVLLSKVCWFLSQFVFGKIRPFIMSKNESTQFSKYKEVLETIRMPGEDAKSLWSANESAFEKTQNHFKKSIEKGKNSSKELISLIEHKTGPPEDEALTTLEEEKHFKIVGKKSWKMRAVSLIHLMIYFYDGTDSDVVNDCLEACSQAWCFMDMVDRSDPEAKLVSEAADKKLVSEAADNEFNTLENVWKKHRKIQSLQNSKRNQSDEEEGENRRHNQWEESRSNNLLRQKIKKPLKENMERLSEEEAYGKEGNRNPCVDTLHDSKDFKRVAAEISLYKFWKAKDLNSNSDYSIHDLRSLLANVICHCLEEEVLNKAIRKNCNKWAEDGEENKIFNAASIAGKAKGVRQEVQDICELNEIFNA